MEEETLNQLDKMIVQAQELNNDLTTLEAAVATLTAANERLTKERDALKAALENVVDYLEDHADVVDGSDGRPVPNSAMRLLQAVEAALKLVEE